MDELNGKKLTKSTSGLRMIPTGERYASPFALEEPMWMPDREVTNCVNCEQRFDFLNRRHHCRRCGVCFCSRCCSNLIPLPRMYFIDPVRHCYDCAIVSKKEDEFYKKGLGILMTGTTNFIQRNIDPENNKEKLGTFLCRLTSDNRYIEFVSEKAHEENNLAPPKRVLLSKVTGAQILTEPISPSGQPERNVAAGIELNYKDEDDSSITYYIFLHSVDQRTSVPWFIAAHRALKMIFESREQRLDNHG